MFQNNVVFLKPKYSQIKGKPQPAFYIFLENCRIFNGYFCADPHLPSDQRSDLMWSDGIFLIRYLWYDLESIYWSSYHWKLRRFFDGRRPLLKVANLESNWNQESCQSINILRAISATILWFSFHFSQFDLMICLVFSFIFVFGKISKILNYRRYK